MTVDLVDKEFDIDIAAFPDFEYYNLSVLHVEFAQGKVRTTADLEGTPDQIESGITETDIALPDGLDYAASGLSALLVFDEPPELDLAWSETSLKIAP